MNDLDTRLAVGAAYRRDPIGTMHGFEAYRELAPGNAARVDAFLRAHGRDEDASAALRRLVQSGEFDGCDAPAQAALLDAALEHPDPTTLSLLQQLAGERDFRELDGPRADAAAERLASGAGPSPENALARSGMPAARPGPIAWTQVAEAGLQAVHYLEGVAEAPVAHWIARGVAATTGTSAAAVLPVAGGVLAGASALLGIYGSIHAAEQAHADGRAIGEAAAHGQGFVSRLRELASDGPETSRAGPAARGAANAEDYWRGLGPADRVALRSPAPSGRFFAALASGVLERATGRGR